MRLFAESLFLTVSMTLAIINPVLIGKYIDMLSTGTNIHHIIICVLFFVTLWLIGILISYARSINGSHMNIRLMYSINFHLLQHTERLPYATLAKIDTVYLNNRIHNDSFVLASFFLDSLLGTIINAITCLIVMGVIFYINPFIGFLIMFVLPSYVLIYKHFNIKIVKSSKEMMESRDIFSGEMQKQLRHVRTIKLNAWYERLYDSLIKQFAPVYKMAIKNAHISSLYSSFTQITQVVANVIIFLICGIAVSNGIMKLGSLITVNSLFAILFSSFSSLMDFGRSYANASAAFSRVKELEIANEEKNGTLIPDRINEIQVKNLTFHYPDDNKLIMNHIDLQFTAGKIYQIKGENGCGKSTLLNLLMGLFETSGQICFNGTPINLMNMLLIRQKIISIVEQEPPLVFENIIENIMSEDICSTELIEKIHEADLDTFVGNLDLLSNRNLFDGTNSLSGGEKQKVAILRALLKDSQVLIFDEPTSALDSQSCEQLKKILKKLKHNRIIILVDHQSAFSDIVDVSYCLHSGIITNELYS